MPIEIRPNADLPMHWPAERQCAHRQKLMTLSVATSKPASAGHFKTSHLEGRFFDRVGWAEFKG
jgi:hypothetical protein